MQSTRNTIEMSAVHAVEGLILRSPRLTPLLTKLEKIPITDGGILVYQTDNNKNEGYQGRVCVQIKGTEALTFSEGNVSFSLTVQEMTCYKRDFGLIFFVVEINPKDFSSKIFYKHLLPVDIEDLLLYCKEHDQKSRTIHLAHLDSKSAIDLEVILFNFLMHREMQAGKPIIDIRNLGPNDDIQLRYISKANDPIRPLLAGEAYFYKKAEGDFQPIGKATIESVDCKVNKTVEANGKVFYNEYRMGSSRDDGAFIRFGKSLTVYAEKRKYIIEPTGTLNEKTVDVEFILSTIRDKHKIIIAGNDIGMTLHDIDEKTLRQLERSFVLFLDTRTMLNTLGVNIDINIQEYSPVHLRLLYNLTEHMVRKGKSSILESIPQGGIRRIGFPDIGILVIRIGDDILNFFDNAIVDNYSFLAQLSDGESTLEVGPYHLLTSDLLVGCVNVDCQAIKRSIDKYPINNITNKLYTNLLLEFIKAYDKSGREDFYTLSLHLSEVLYDFDDSPSSFINLMQLHKRKRELSEIEKSKLKSFLVDGGVDANIINCRASILLDLQDEFKHSYELLSDDIKKLFKTFPIYALTKQEV